MTWHDWLGLTAAVLAIVAIVLAVWVARRQASGRLGPAAASAAPATAAGEVQTGPDDEERPLVAFVANPSKPDVAALRSQVVKACSERYLPEPLWLETTVEDPGVGQAREAVERGAKLVVAVGGDGTVRAVAEALVHTDVPMALLPLGTGNLLARNLDIPVGDPAAAITAALDGKDRTIDVGWVAVQRWAAADAADPDDEVTGPAADPDPDREHIFLVIGGVGFDAAMVASTDDALKAKVGWIAYFVAGVQHLHGRRSRVRVRLDGRAWQDLRLRSLLVGNCGKLPGGLQLLPDAVLDDGWLDIAAIDTRGGVAGWAQLLGEVVLQGFGLRNPLPARIGRIDHTRARSVDLQLAGGEHVQLDGDVLGRVAELAARVDPGALVVRVPASAS